MDFYKNYWLYWSFFQCLNTLYRIDRNRFIIRKQQFAHKNPHQY